MTVLCWERACTEKVAQGNRPPAPGKPALDFFPCEKRGFPLRPFQALRDSAGPAQERKAFLLKRIYVPSMDLIEVTVHD